MKFYFDESGSFRVPDDKSEHAVGIVVGVVVPESIEESVFQRFAEYVRRLPKCALKNGEPKGNLLNHDQRWLFAELISECEGILICPTMLDLTSIAGRAAEIHDGMVARIEETAAKCKYETMQRQVQLLARQVRKLNPVQGLRLGAWARCIKRCIIDSTILHSQPEFNDCWSSLTFEIDAVQMRAGSREEQTFKRLLPSWVTAWSKQDPLVMIEGIHTSDHPFVQTWETEDGIDIGKMFRRNVHFVSSRSNLGVQLADIAASVVKEAVVGIVSTDDLTNYGVMMSKSIRPATHAHGICSVVEVSQDDIARRYYGLVAAISRARRVTPHAYALP